MTAALHFIQAHWLPIVLIGGIIAASLYVYRNRIHLFYKE
jgi:hypothetical protein